METTKIKLADQILHEGDLTGKYTDTRGKGTFIYKFPTPRQRALIEHEIAVKVGVPVENFNEFEYQTIRVCVYLDNILTKTPDWWTSAEDCYDEELCMAIFKEFLKDQDNFRGRLREGKFKTNSG